MTSQTLLHAKEAFETLDAEKILEVYGEPFLFEDLPSNQSITDKTALRAYFEALFGLPEVAFSEINILEASSFAAIEWSWSGLSHSSAKPFRIRGASLLQLSDGKIARETLYYDPRQFLA